MIALLRRLLAFLETRFPERVEVTKADYDRLNRELEALHATLPRLEKIEGEINKFNYAMGFGGVPKTMQGVLER